MRSLKLPKVFGKVTLAVLATAGLTWAGGGFAAPETVKKRYIVVLKPGQAAAEAVRAGRGHVVHKIPDKVFGSQALAVELDTEGARAIAARADVAFVEEDARRFPLATETTPWGITAIGNLASASSGAAMVCIIDSGYRLSHEDLPKNVTASPDTGTGDPFEDGCGHGTHVAGTIAALQNGLGVVGVDSAGGTNLHIVKVFANSCSWTYSSTLVTALSRCRDAATKAGKKLVVNMSLGGDLRSRAEETAFADASKAGVISVAAAGNDGSTRRSFPASYPSVISVAAVDQKLQVASFSQRNADVDLAAPGVGVLSTVPAFSESKVTTSSGVAAPGFAIEFAPQTSGTGVSRPFANGGLCSASSAGFAGRVVLCERGSISFADKVLNAQAGGAVAVVIYNNVAGEFSGTLGSATTGVTIPAITVSRESGLLLLAEVPKEVSATVVNFVDPVRSGYAYYDGTSMATPHVAGAAAVLWNAVPRATAAGVRSALERTATDLGVAGRDDAYGFGFINLPRAYTELLAYPAGRATTCTKRSGC